MDVTALLTFAMQSKASDVHLSSGEPPIIRIDGDMKRLDHPVLSRDDVHAMVYDILNDSRRKSFEEHLELDFSLDLGEIGRFRVNVFMQQRGEAAVFRLIPNKVKTLEELGMPKVLKDLADKERGLVVVTGPTGSGKSTTLAAMVDYINETLRGHILTVEDPIEFVHESKRCLVNQREVGPHTQNFANALRAALREDPDVILVGELRDLETTQLAITAAETGHLVFATLHTNSASKTIDRMIDIFPSGQQAQVRTMLSESLEGIVAQTLLPSKDGKGRVAAIEVLVGVPALRNLIREDKTAQILSVIQTGAQHGMQSLDQSLRDLVMQGRLSRTEAMKRASSPHVFESPGAAPGAPSGGPARPAAPGAARPAAPAEPPRKGGLFSR
jgi:twitching motility protein PilT